MGRVEILGGSGDGHPRASSDGRATPAGDGHARASSDGRAQPTGDSQPASASPEDFLAAFDAFVQAVRRARGAPAHDDERGLTLSQYGLLQPLATCADARVRELAEQAGIAAPTATRILDALERRGIVERRRSAHDRRGVSVTLTSLGREVLGAEDEWMRARERDFYAHLPVIERELVPDLLLRLAGLIDELAGGP